MARNTNSVYNKKGWNGEKKKTQKLIFRIEAANCTKRFIAFTFDFNNLDFFDIDGCMHVEFEDFQVISNPHRIMFLANESVRTRLVDFISSFRN